MTLEQKKQKAADWFRNLRDQICSEFEQIEMSPEFSSENSMGHSSGLARSPDRAPAKFERKLWQREGGGGGEMSLMKGKIFEKVGVNISTVMGEFSETMRKEIPGADKNPTFWASGISIVAHMCSPLVPAVHMNTRMIVIGDGQEARSGDRTSLEQSSMRAPEGAQREHPKNWFGGGSDLTPMIPNDQDTKDFHAAFKIACDKFDPDYYPKFKTWCDEYFFLKHRNEPRGIGGIFYDYVNTGDWERDFAFTQEVGKTFLTIYPQIVHRHMKESWTKEQREHQLMRRGRYVEFNLLYDRGTRFGLMTGGNTEAILMSMPPEVKWP